MPTEQVILITGATGKQGGAVARALLAAGAPVRALVRNPHSEKARELADLGVEVAPGDLDDATSIAAAARGARGVFSVQLPDIHDLMGGSELRHAQNLLLGCRAAGVEQVVHTSVSGAGSLGARDFEDRRWGDYPIHYWRSKAGVERLVRDAGFTRWTILRPGAFMENLIRPSYWFAELTSDRLLIAANAETPVAFVTVDDIGTAAAAAFADPVLFDRVELELVGDILTYGAAAEILTGALGTTIVAPHGPQAARDDGLLPLMADAQEFAQAHRPLFGPEQARSLGLPMTTFQHWVDRTFTAPVLT